MTPRFPKCLRVMAEYASSGIWVVEPYGPFRHGMIEHRSLGLADDLARGFREWIDRYWKVLDAPEEFDTQSFNEEGRRLAIALKRHVGPATKVLFASEAADGHRGVEEEVE
jgi:hypothetical protein